MCQYCVRELRNRAVNHGLQQGKMGNMILPKIFVLKQLRVVNIVYGLLSGSGGMADTLG